MVNAAKMQIEHAQLLMKYTHICCIFLKNNSETVIKLKHVKARKMILKRDRNTKALILSHFRSYPRVFI